MTPLYYTTKPTILDRVRKVHGEESGPVLFGVFRLWTASTTKTTFEKIQEFQNTAASMGHAKNTKRSDKVQTQLDAEIAITRTNRKNDESISTLQVDLRKSLLGNFRPPYFTRSHYKIPLRTKLSRKFFQGY